MPRTAATGVGESGDSSGVILLVSVALCPYHLNTSRYVLIRTSASTKFKGINMPYHLHSNFYFADPIIETCEIQPKLIDFGRNHDSKDP